MRADPLGLAGVAVRARRPLTRLQGDLGRSSAWGWLSLVVTVALLAPVLPLADPIEGGMDFAEGPGWGHLLGTDRLGRDILSRVIFGARASLQVAASVIGVSMVIGTALGMLAAYLRGVVDLVVTAVSDLILSLPGMVLLLVLVSLRGATTGTLILGISILLTPTFVRVARANTMRFMEREFVIASKGLGATNARVLFKDLLPNVLPPVRVYAMTAAAQVLVAEGALSFLALGVPPPTPTWGGMIADGRSLLTYHPHIVIVPSVVLLLTVVALNRLGDRVPLRHAHPPDRP